MEGERMISALSEEMVWSVRLLWNVFAGCIPAGEIGGVDGNTASF